MKKEGLIYLGALLDNLLKQIEYTESGADDAKHTYVTCPSDDHEFCLSDDDMEVTLNGNVPKRLKAARLMIKDNPLLDDLIKEMRKHRKLQGMSLLKIVNEGRKVFKDVEDLEED